MAQFEITTDSNYRTRYLIEAASKEEAVEKFGDEPFIDGYQHFGGEIITNVIETTESKDNWIVRQHNENFF